MLNVSAILHMAEALEEKIPDKLWDFRHTGLVGLDPDCETVACAVGHAPAIFGCDPGCVAVARVLGMPEPHARVIFGYRYRYTPWLYGEKCHEKVTRHDVAAALRRYADEGPWWEHKSE